MFFNRQTVSAPETVQPPVDFQVTGHGSVYLLFPKSDEACQWVADHLPDDVQMLGAGVAVEHRYISAIVEGIWADGLSVA